MSPPWSNRVECETQQGWVDRLILSDLRPGPYVKGDHRRSMKLRHLLSLEKNASRLGEIVGILAKYGFADWLSGTDYDWLRDRVKSARGAVLSDLTTGERLRHALEELGPSFVKLGQILSTRPDLVGIEITKELSKLQTETEPDEWEKTSATLEEELGGPIEDHFAHFEQKPIASGSIGQVHVAVTKEGERVVVKVMHRDTESRVREDLELMVALAELAHRHAHQLRRYQPLATAQYFKRTLLRELDFDYERRHIERFRADFREDPSVYFPRAFADLSSERVLTMEKLEGIPIWDVERLRAVGCDLDEFARRGGDMYLRMIFTHGFYHADPHPGNLFRLEDDVVGVIDCGMVGYLDEGLREEIEAMLLAATSEDAVGLTDAIVRVGQVPPELDEDELRARVSEFLAEYTDQSVGEFDVAGALRRLFDLVRDFHILLPQSFAMLVKALVVLEGTSRRLSPDFSLAELLRPYYAEAVKRHFSPRRIYHDLARNTRDWKRLADSLPRDIGDIVTRFRKGTLEVHMEHRRLESTVDRLVLGLLTAAVFMGSTLMWSMEAAPTVFGISLFGALGFVASIFMGLPLLLAMRRESRKRKEKGRR